VVTFYEDVRHEDEITEFGELEEQRAEELQEFVKRVGEYLSRRD
jgi:hypothetical protein